MTKAEKVSDILNILDKFYPNPEVPLHHKDAFTLLISVLLSAQCTDVRVNKTTPFLFKRADNPYDMVKMSADEIREIIKPCGLSPMKSKGIYGLSKILIEKYDGKVPNTFEALEELRFMLDKRIKPVYSPREAILLAIHECYEREEGAASQLMADLEINDDLKGEVEIYDLLDDQQAQAPRASLHVFGRADQSRR